MIEGYKVSNILNELGINFIEKNGHFKCKCPICGDSKKSEKIKRLKISYYSKYDNWLGYCWNGGCECKGYDIYTIYSKLKSVSYNEAKKYINDEIYNAKKIKKRLKRQKQNIHKEKTHINTFDINFDTECLEIDTNTNSVIEQRYIDHLKKFIETRHIPIKCCIAHTGKYKGRIIIPVIINDKIVYYQGRSIFDSITPKYLNPDIDKSPVIVNSDKFDKTKSIIVSEGLLDSYMVEYNQGTSFLGSYASDDFIERLYKYTDKDIIIAWDNPFIDKAGKEELIKFIEESKYGKNVKYFLMPYKNCKDLNDLKVNHPNLNIYDVVLSNSYGYYNVMVKLLL